MNRVAALLAGPHGRALCAAVAEASSPEATWWRLSVDELVAALRTVREEQVAALGEPRLFAELATVVSQAYYWQEPGDDRKRLARPEVVAALRPIADAVTRHPAAAWWSDPVDRADQNVVRFLLDDWMPLNSLEDARPHLTTWRDEVADEQRGGTEDPHWRSTTGRWWTAPERTGIVWTSGTRPELGAVKLHTTEDDMGWQRARVHPVHVEPGARVREIDGPRDWAALVDEFPLEVTREKRGDWGNTTGRDGRWWIPDWAAVAEEYDAVHVTVLGYLSTAGCAVDTELGASVLAGWGPGHTCWLRPDRLTYTGVVEQWHQRSGGSPVEEMAWRRIPADGPDGTVELRPVVDDDEALLAEATLGNVTWDGEERVTATDVAADPALAHYTSLRPGRGDFGRVVEVGGVPVGVVWLLFLGADDPGYGYVADGVPELSVWVRSGYRGVGLGRLLMTEALKLARSSGLERVSLSVDNFNPAKRLYIDLGFVNERDAALGTMVLDLVAEPAWRALMG